MINLDYFNENFIENLPNNRAIIIENQIRNQKFLMRLNIDFQDCENVYRLIEENDEKTKIKFLRNLEFPDGVFIKEVDEKNYKIIIIELKKSAKNHLDKIPKQLHSGLLHAISLIELSFTNVVQPNINREKINIMFELYVGSVHHGEQKQFNRKVIPGILTPEQSKSIAYDNDEVFYKIKNGNTFSFKIKKLKFKSVTSSGEFEEFEASIAI